MKNKLYISCKINDEYRQELEQSWTFIDRIISAKLQKLIIKYQ